METIKKFEVGKTYYARSICNHDCIFTMEVVSRTEKTVTYIFEGEKKRSSIKHDDHGNEWIKSHGYSMAPVFRAERQQEEQEQDDLEEWQQKKATVTMTNEEWLKLTTYLLMSTNHRKGEAEAWERLATETNEDGSPKFKNAASNAEFWREMMVSIDNIRKTIDGERKYEA